MTARKDRADRLLEQRGLAADLREAQALILAGRVYSLQVRVDKPGTLLATEAPLGVRPAGRFVSRGGDKLQGALKALSLDVKGSICLDLGASTGGFTDCLLQAGASRVWAFDVGAGQLDWSLRNDRRVRVREGINVRHITPEMVDESVDLIVADLSFISLRLILPALKTFCPVRALVLVKPQFEAERDEVQAGGIVRDEALREEVVQRVRSFAAEQGFEIRGQVDSDVAGRKGNREVFLLLCC